MLPATRQRCECCLYPQPKQVLDLVTLEGRKAHLYAKDDYIMQHPHFFITNHFSGPGRAISSVRVQTIILNEMTFDLHGVPIKIELNTILPLFL